MAFQADVVFIDKIQGAQIVQGRFAAATTAKKASQRYGRFTITVPDHVGREDDIASSGKLDGKAVLGFARVDVAMHRQNARGRCVFRCPFRHIEQGAHQVTVNTHKP